MKKPDIFSKPYYPALFALGIIFVFVLFWFIYEKNKTPQELVLKDIAELRFDVDPPTSRITIHGNGKVFYGAGSRNSRGKFLLQLNASQMQGLLEQMNRDHFLTMNNESSNHSSVTVGHLESKYALTVFGIASNGKEIAHTVACNQFSCDKKFLEIVTMIFEMTSPHTTPRTTAKISR